MSVQSTLESKPHTISPKLDLILAYHFRRAYCTICGVVMKQGSNMGTHLNTQYVSAATFSGRGAYEHPVSKTIALCALVVKVSLIQVLARDIGRPLAMKRASPTGRFDQQ